MPGIFLLDIDIHNPMHCFRRNTGSKYKFSPDDSSVDAGKGMSDFHLLSWFDWVKAKKEKKPKRRLDRYNHGRRAKGKKPDFQKKEKKIDLLNGIKRKMLASFQRHA